MPSVGGFLSTPTQSHSETNELPAADIQIRWHNTNTMAMDPGAFLKACEDGEVEAVRAAVEAGQDCSGVCEGK